MHAYKALGCDSGEVGAPMKKLQPAREMSLEARATPVSQCVEALLGQKPQRHWVRLMDGEASGTGDRPPEEVWLLHLWQVEERVL